MKFSVFTVVMAEFAAEETVDKLAEWGFDGIEWRVHTIDRHVPPDKVNRWTVNRSTIDLERLEELAPQFADLTHRAGLEVSHLTSYLGLDRTEDIERLMRAATVMETSCVRVNVPGQNPEIGYRQLYETSLRNLEVVQNLAERYSVRANLEIHMGNIIPSAGLAWRLVHRFDPKRIGLIYDPGNMIYEGYENWRMGLELLGEYVGHVHYKNSAWHPHHVDEDGNLCWRASWADMRTGIVNWREVLEALVTIGYEGYLSSEDFWETPVEQRIPDGLGYLRGLLESIPRE